jgi:hypothetical protein
MIDSAVLGGPYVFAAATLASSRPAAPFVFRCAARPQAGRHSGRFAAFMPAMRGFMAQQRTRPFLPCRHRNYELPPEAAPLAAAMRACGGSSRHEVWQAVRASSAAPYCEPAA